MKISLYKCKSLCYNNNILIKEETKVKNERLYKKVSDVLYDGKIVKKNLFETKYGTYFIYLVEYKKHMLFVKIRDKEILECNILCEIAKEDRT